MNTNQFDDRDFAESQKHQNAAFHIHQLKRLGYCPEDYTGQHLKRRDLRCPKTASTFECKFDRHAPNNFCIELADNLRDYPPFPARVEPYETEYETAIQFLRGLWMSQKHLSLGLSTDIEANHYLSYAFSNGTHLLLPLADLQQFVFDALKDRRYPLIHSSSYCSGSFWYSVSVLLPVDDVSHFLNSRTRDLRCRATARAA